MLKQLYAYRELLKTSVKKDIRGKYKASMLGVLWSFINPLLQVLVYAIVFPYILGRSSENYVIYLVTGIIPWTFFSTTINACVGIVKNNANIIKKVYFPRIILPISSGVSGLVNFFISCVIIILFCIVGGVGISWHIIFVPLIALIELMLALGIGMIFGACDAYVQDLEYIVAFILQMAFYGSPIVYQMSFVSGQSLLSKLIQINPVTIIINSYRDVFMNHTCPDMMSLSIVFVISACILALGCFVFKKLEKGFAEQF
jgi:lipopolysaccharide transport system permease protein